MSPFVADLPIFAARLKEAREQQISYHYCEKSDGTPDTHFKGRLSESLDLFVMWQVKW
jgi:hypothetical protein